MIEISEGKTHLTLPAETPVSIAGLNGRLAAAAELVVEGEYGPDELAASFVAGGRTDLLPLLEHRHESGILVKYSAQGERCLTNGEKSLREELAGLTLKKLLETAESLEIEIPNGVKKKAEIIEILAAPEKEEDVRHLIAAGAPSS